MARDDALRYWLSSEHEVSVAVEGAGRVLGTYYLRANQGGAGSHVANCGYMVLPSAEGRGIGRALCMHSIERARERGFRFMQFNLVVSTNERAVHLWQSCGFAVLCRLPEAFEHPRLGFVDALVMYRAL
jgi:GNAT superfamily N-acetyltransferase